MKTIVMPRQIAMYLSRELTDSSLPKIGNEFGGKILPPLFTPMIKLLMPWKLTVIYKQKSQILKPKLKGSPSQQKK